jgi:CRISPR-associated endonuclease/helicase Cas3
MKLLAKKPSNEREITIFEHSCDVLQAFDYLFGTAAIPTRLGECWLRFFGIRGNKGFYACTKLAIIFHDAGKANSGFQDAVQGIPDSQLIRHEHLSGLLLVFDRIKGRLTDLPDVDFDVVLCAVIGHHLRSSQDEFATRLDPNRSVFQVFAQGINNLFRLAVPPACLDLPMPIISDSIWGFDGKGDIDIVPLAQVIRRRLNRFKRGGWKDDQTRRLTIAVRAALIVADSAASALTREGKDTSAWLRFAFDEAALLTGEYIEREIIGPRKRQTKTVGRWKGWNDFQLAAESLSDRALLIASCGSGKTLAAWRWIKAILEKRPVARVIFLYPTRGTATEGFRDYVSWAPEADALLVHGTAAYELDGMFENPDERATKDYSSEDRLFAIGYWQRRVFSATVDQFLGFMQHVYRSVCLLPMLVDSVVVIDEVHSFDKSLFSALRLFLKFTQDSGYPPVLCMTASLPESRKEHLVDDCGLELFPPTINEYEDLKRRARMPRYAVQSLPDENAAEDIVHEELDAKTGKRILWVVNTVDRCQQLARKFGALCYHSRFKLDDRKVRHNDVIRAFKQAGKLVVAITTQVCEMSLDLDANVLISEAAPVTSLIQRMGRCNRHAEPDEKKLGRVFVYEPESRTPYSDGDWQGAAEFLSAIDGQSVSQARLQELLEEFGPAAVEVERYAAFLESGPWAIAREESLRDIREYTVQSILDDDIPDYLERRRNRETTDGLIVPAPRFLANRDDRLGAFPQVVPASCYTRKYGLFRETTEEG